MIRKTQVDALKAITNLTGKRKQVYDEIKIQGVNK